MTGFEPDEVDQIILDLERRDLHGHAACLRWMRRNLDERDQYLVEQGRWSDFVETVSKSARSLPQPSNG